VKHPGYRGWYVRYHDHLGRRTMCVGGQTRRDAEAVLAQKQDEVEERLTKGIRPTILAEFVEEYSTTLQGVLRPRSYKSVSAHLLRAAAFFGEVEMDRITRRDVEEFVAELVGEALTPTTVRNHFYSLRRAFRTAVDRGFMSTSPCEGVKLPRLREFPVPWISPKDLDRLLQKVVADARPEITLLAETGLRLGELLALDWGDVPTDLSGVTVKAGKTGRTRFVPLDKGSRGQRVLAELRARRDPIPLHGRHPVCAWTEPQLRSRFRAAVKMAKLPHLRLHDLRHAFAAHLVRAGVPVPTVSKLLGHSTPHLVLTRYGHHAPDDAGVRATSALAAYRDGGSSSATPSERGAPAAPRPRRAADDGR
jgi:integrase